ncbi:MAG: PRC-barrel domain-containing protein [Cyclobacteriaceae bacterium]
MNTDGLINFEVIKSASIKDSVGNDYGSVSDIVINRSTGMIEFLVIGTGGILGIGRDYFTIPFQSVDINPNTDTIIMNVTKEKIENAPRFENDKVTKWSEKERTRMMEYYGISNRSDQANDNIDGREPSLADKKHQEYEGSSQVTNAQGPGDTIPGNKVNYDKMKGTD